MIQREVKITNNSGLHARPATFFIQKANTYRSGVWVVKDDRKVSAGFMFSDADLLGVPIRVVVSPRNLQEGNLEISTRDKSVKEMVALADGLEYIIKLKEKMFSEL